MVYGLSRSNISLTTGLLLCGFGRGSTSNLIAAALASCTLGRLAPRISARDIALSGDNVGLTF